MIWTTRKFDFKDCHCFLRIVMIFKVSHRFPWMVITFMDCHGCSLIFHYCLEWHCQLNVLGYRNAHLARHRQQIVIKQIENNSKLQLKICAEVQQRQVDQKDPTLKIKHRTQTWRVRWANFTVLGGGRARTSTSGSIRPPNAGPNRIRRKTAIRCRA